MKKADTQAIGNTVHSVYSVHCCHRKTTTSGIQIKMVAVSFTIDKIQLNANMKKAKQTNEEKSISFCYCFQ